MACPYHWDRREGRKANHYSNMIDKITAEIEGLGYEANSDYTLPDDSGSVGHKEKAFTVNCSCAGCSVMHFLHALAAIEIYAEPVKESDSSLEYSKRVDKRAEEIAGRMDLGLDDEEWVQWRLRPPVQSDRSGKEFTDAEKAKIKEIMEDRAKANMKKYEGMQRDMHADDIDINICHGEVKVSVGGVVIGLLQSLKLDAAIKDGESVLDFEATRLVLSPDIWDKIMESGGTIDDFEIERFEGVDEFVKSVKESESMMRHVFVSDSPPTPIL